MRWTWNLLIEVFALYAIFKTLDKWILKLLSIDTEMHIYGIIIKCRIQFIKVKAIPLRRDWDMERNILDELFALSVIELYMILPSKYNA